MKGNSRQWREREFWEGPPPRFLFCFSFPCFVPILSVPQPVPLCVVIQNVDKQLVEYSAGGGRFQILLPSRESEDFNETIRTRDDYQSLLP